MPDIEEDKLMTIWCLMLHVGWHLIPALPNWGTAAAKRGFVILTPHTAAGIHSADFFCYAADLFKFFLVRFLLGWHNCCMSVLAIFNPVTIHIWWEWFSANCQGGDFTIKTNTNTNTELYKIILLAESFSPLSNHRSLHSSDGGGGSPPRNCAQLL